MEYTILLFRNTKSLIETDPSKQPLMEPLNQLESMICKDLGLESLQSLDSVEPLALTEATQAKFKQVLDLHKFAYENDKAFNDLKNMIKGAPSAITTMI